jgi:acylphosphatase
MILRLIVKGRVQGVNFRNMTKSFADKEKILGRIRNCSDGHVEIIVKGSEKKLGNLIAWLRSSPGFSKVEDIEVKKFREELGIDGFEVIREHIVKDQGRSMKNLGKRILKL